MPGTWRLSTATILAGYLLHSLKHDDRVAADDLRVAGQFGLARETRNQKGRVAYHHTKVHETLSVRFLNSFVEHNVQEYLDRSAQLVQARGLGARTS